MGLGKIDPSQQCTSFLIWARRRRKPMESLAASKIDGVRCRGRPAERELTERLGTQWGKLVPRFYRIEANIEEVPRIRRGTTRGISTPSRDGETPSLRWIRGTSRVRIL